MRTRWFAASVVAGVAVGCVTHGSEPPAPGDSAAAATEVVADARTEEVKRLDAALEAGWKDKGLAIAAAVDDDVYLRRASIDLIGRIPTIDELTSFQKETALDKRSKAVERLLDTPEHAAHLGRVWDRLLLGPQVKNRQVDRGALRRWLEQRFASDAPWDDTVRQLIGAQGTTSIGGKVAEAVLSDNPSRSTAEKTAGINGAANYALRFAQSPQDMAGQTSRVFLGVQIQCAQCHDHKTEKWKRQDFQAMAATFTRVKVTPVEREKGNINVYDIEPIDRPAKRLLKNEDTAAIAKVAPRALDGTDLSTDPDPRKALARWVTNGDNPWFARAMVNRVWAELIGEGFVDPVDDMRSSNEVVLAGALDGLAKDFGAHHYDLDWLYATICASKAYDRGIGDGSEARTALFSHATLRPLSSDALLDSLLVATEVESRLRQRAPERISMLKTQIRNKMSFVFDDDVESNAAEYDGTLQQAFFTMNGALPTASTTYAEGTLLGRLLHTDDDASVIDELYRRTLGRRPTTEELQRARAALGTDTTADPGNGSRKGGKKAKKGKKGTKGGPAYARPNIPAPILRSDADDARERGYEDLLWALVNSSEFTFRR